MKLDSVRELKARLTTSLTEDLLHPQSTLRIMSLAAQPMENLAVPHRSIALGVAPAGDKGYKLAVRVQRRSMLDSPQIEKIQRTARGEVDVRYVGRVVRRATPWYRKRNRPLRIGGSIGHYKVTAGTLGCFVERRSDGKILILSNNHVLANENRAKKGDPVLQPGPYDGGKRPTDVVARLESFVRLSSRRSNFVDCALARVMDSVSFDPEKLTGLGKLGGVSSVEVEDGTVVAKLGRTTGRTRGVITAFEMDNVVVTFDIGDIRFDDQIEILGDGPGPFSDGGDSGSLIVDGDNQAVGLLFAGSEHGGEEDPGYTYANPIKTVLKRLKVDWLY